jgi:hypothetical protein
MSVNWLNIQTLPAIKYKCGFCSEGVGSETGFQLYDTINGQKKEVFIYICPYCKKPTYVEEGEQFPGSVPGGRVKHLPDGIERLFEESRRCVSNRNYTAAVLVCRKILAHVAVEKGAKENAKFIDFVEHLSDKGYITPDGKGWVDHIRTKGNEANHEIKLMSADDAISLVTFTEMLLRIVYELPLSVPGPPNS